MEDDPRVTRALQIMADALMADVLVFADAVRPTATRPALLTPEETTGLAVSAMTYVQWHLARSVSVPPEVFMVAMARAARAACIGSEDGHDRRH